MAPGHAWAEEVAKTIPPFLFYHYFVRELFRFTYVVGDCGVCLCLCVYVCRINPLGYRPGSHPRKDCRFARVLWRELVHTTCRK